MKLFPKLFSSSSFISTHHDSKCSTQLVRFGTPRLFFFYYFDHLLVYSILIPSFDFYCPKSIKCKLYISFIDHSLLFIHWNKSKYKQSDTDFQLIFWCSFRWCVSFCFLWWLYLTSQKYSTANNPLPEILLNKKATAEGQTEHTIWRNI